MDDDDDDDVDDDDDEQNMELVAVRFPVPAFGCPMCNMKDVSAQFLVAIVIITIVILSALIIVGHHYRQQVIIAIPGEKVGGLGRLGC